MTPPTPPAPSASQHHLVQSNSTANIFLGGRRRSWMEAAGTTHPRSPASHATTTTPAAALPSAPPTASLDSAAAPAPPAREPPAVSTLPPSTRSAPPPEPVQTQRHGAAEGQGQRQGNSPAVLISPSEQLLSSLSTSLGKPSDVVVSAPSSRPGQTTTSSVSTSTPPSVPPVSQPTLTTLSTENLPAPVWTTVGNTAPPSGGPVASPATSASARAQTESPPLHAPPPRDAVPTSLSSIPGGAVNMATRPPRTQQPHQHGQPQFLLSTSHPPHPSTPAQASPQIPNPMPLSARQEPHPQSQQMIPAPQFFQIVQKRLYADPKILEPEIANLRAAFLAQACEQHDFLFLAVHQIYCLYSYAPATLNQLQNFTSMQVRGLSVVSKLLVGNQNVSMQFLHLCSHLPLPLPAAMQIPDYRNAMQRALWCLRWLTENWDAYIQQKVTSGLPPFAEEIQLSFGINSPVLGYSIFLSGCRRLHRGIPEDKLRAVWNLDLMYYNRRCRMPTPSATQHGRDHDVVIRKYKSLVTATQASQPPPHAPVDSQMWRTADSDGSNGSNAPNPQVPQTASNELPVHLAIQPGSNRASVSARPSSIPPANHPTLVSRAVNSPRATASARFTSSPTTFTPNMYQARPPPTQVPANLHTTGPVPTRRDTFTPTHGIVHPQGSSAAHSPPNRPSPGACSYPPSTFSAQPMIRLPTDGTASPRHAPVAAPRGHPAPQVQHQPMMANGTRPPPPPRVPRLPMQAQAQHAPSAWNLLLPPRSDAVTINDPPHPIRHAIQQSYLGAPCNIVAERKGEITAGDVVLYLSSFAVPPAPLGQSRSAYKWQFPLSKAAIDRFPNRQARGAGYRPLQALVNGSHIYRLRCIRVPPAATGVSEDSWSVAETSWPSVMYLFVNDLEVFVRRKMQNTKDLPLDITGWLREGDNTIIMHYIRSPAERHDVTFALAIEVLDICDLATAESLVQTLPAADSRDQIRKRLTSETGDDDLSVVSEDLTVNLVDPFTARIFDVPVRGRLCKHQECFDLKTYLSTRVFKAGKRDLDECWRCPICGRDARPQSLIIDKFFSEVHAELKRADQLDDARAIQVKMDGTWKLKSDADTQPTSDRATVINNAKGHDSLRIKRKCVDSIHDQNKRPKLEERFSTGRVIQTPPQSSEVIIID